MLNCFDNYVHGLIFRLPDFLMCCCCGGGKMWFFVRVSGQVVGQNGSEVGVLCICWTWSPPGIMTCSTPGLRVVGQTSPFLRWAVNWPQGQSVRLGVCFSLCVSACVCVWTSVSCDLIYPDKATGPNNKNVYFSLSLSHSIPLSASFRQNGGDD